MNIDVDMPSVKRRQAIKCRRRAGAIIAVTAVIGLVPACSSSGASTGGGSAQFKIGVLADLSGPVAVYDKPAVAGLQSYIDAQNKKGGVGSHQIKLVIYDTKSDVPTSRTDFSALQSQGVEAIMGPILSTAYSAVQPLAEKARIALISTGAPPDAVEKAQPYFYLTGIPLPEEAGIAVKHVSQVAGTGAKPRIAALSTTSVSTEAWRNALSADVKSAFGTSVVSNLQLDPTAIDPSTQVAQIVASKPDYVMLRILSSQVPLAVKDLRAKGFTGEIISDYGGADTAVLKSVDDPKYLGIRMYVDGADSSDPAVKGMLADAKAAGVGGQASGWAFSYGFLNGSIFVQTLAQCGASCTSAKFASTLAGLKTIKGAPGFSGPLGYSSGSHQIVNYGRLYRWDSANNQAVAVTGWINGAS